MAFVRRVTHDCRIFGPIRRQIGDGRAVPSVPQGEIDEGVTFYTADWNAAAQRAALRNFRDDYKNYFADPRIHRKMSAELRLVSMIEKK